MKIKKKNNDWTFLLSEREDIRLPYPYSTNCTDYLSLWNENNGTGPLNKRECIEFCKLENWKSSHECVDPEHVSYAPHMEKLCPGILLKLPFVKDCSRKCQPACREQTYEVKYEEEVDSACPFGSRCHDFIDLKVSFESFKLTKYIDEPNYQVSDEILIEKYD
ncbi:uncharacterized protein [Parasteatoda tepidariorum]|uniref:uncharacterized protein n=1 Tax=Parasteatoda tepidariorum TaxID=114398 RepID=UPI0039BD4816